MPSSLSRLRIASLIARSRRARIHGRGGRAGFVSPSASTLSSHSRLTSAGEKLGRYAALAGIRLRRAGGALLARLLSGLSYGARVLRGRFGRGGPRSSLSNPLDCPLVPLGRVDAFTVRDACEGTAIFGAVGSGKTSGSGAALARACFSAGFGSLILTAKPEERALFEGYARDTGRSDDVIIVSPKTSHRFNFLDYEFTRAGAGAGLVENVVQLFMLALEVAGERQDGGSDQYWKRSTTQLLRNAVHLAGLATGGIRLADILAIIRSAPKSIEDVRSEESSWRCESFCFQQLLVASKTLITESQRLDYDAMEAYWLSEFPDLAQKTRSIIVQSFVSLVDPFTRSPLRELFCTETTFTPEDAQKGKIIILDLPVKEWGDVGRIAQVLFKVCFQKATERRNIEKSPIPVLLFADEAQLFLTSYDELFLQTARSSRAITVYLSQNLPNYYSALGGHQKAEHQANSILGNLSTHIYHANGDANTNEYAAKRIAQVWQMRRGANTGHSSNTSQTGGSLNQDTTTNVNYSDNTGTSMSEQLAYQVLPQEFTTYRQGGPANNFEVDALVFKPGRTFRATGTNYTRVTFRQR
jgi:hypothetical protein